MPDWGLPTVEEQQAVWLALARLAGHDGAHVAPEPAELVDADWRLGWE